MKKKKDIYLQTNTLEQLRHAYVLNLVHPEGQRYSNVSDTPQRIETRETPTFHASHKNGNYAMDAIIHNA
jgi:hypothetical protein